MLQIFQFTNAQGLTNQIDAVSSNNDMMGGAVVVFCESNILETHYFGKSDYQRDLDVNENTKFRIASISKMITAIAIMQLVEQNLLNLDDDISNILGYDIKNPNYPNIAITVRMLLSHTSTIVDGSSYGSFLNATISNNPIPNLSQLLNPTGSYYIANQFNNTVPGTYFNYSNINFVILGTIVEKISNMRFDAYCRQHLFQPLGIDASFNANDLQNIDDIAVLYRKINNVWTSQADDFQGVQPIFANLAGYIPGTNGGRFGPQGGLRCSARDLATLFMCINNPETCATPILNAASAMAMRTANWTYNGSNGNNYGGLFLSWGLGIHRITSTPGSDIALPSSSSMYGHTGEAYGLVSDIYYDTARKVGLVFITNGVGDGYQTNNYSAFYTVEQEVFSAIENYGNVGNCLSLGTNTLLFKADRIAVYPNPAHNFITVEYMDLKNPTDVKIYNVLGQNVLQTNITSQLSTIDLSDLTSGIYLLQVDGRTVRFVKY